MGRSWRMRTPHSCLASHQPAPATITPVLKDRMLETSWVIALPLEFWPRPGGNLTSALVIMTLLASCHPLQKAFKNLRRKKWLHLRSQYQCHSLR